VYVLPPPQLIDIARQLGLAIALLTARVTIVSDVKKPPPLFELIAMCKNCTLTLLLPIELTPMSLLVFAQINPLHGVP
jgi:hypothetical protein